jgi:hypothetical protein
MDNIQQHIQKNEDILRDPTISSQSRRHIEDELESLKVYHENHPDDDHDPTTLELFCDANPDAVECRMFDT